MTVKNIKRGTRKHRRGRTVRKGGRCAARKGGRREALHGGRRATRKGGSGMLSVAALPFGLFGLQKIFQKATTRRRVRKVGRIIKKDLKKLNPRRLFK